MSSSEDHPAMMRVTAPGGATAAVLHHGAQLASWRSASGLENIYLSECADFAPGSSVRGGAPICFPQFSGLGELPMHGFFRNQMWTPVTGGVDEGTIARFRLTDTPESRALWPYAFQAELQATLADNSLEIALTVQNTGTTAFTFTAALHTYFRVNAIEDVTIAGLHNTRYLDKLEGNAVCTENSDRLRIDRPLDRVYYNTVGERILEEDGRRLRISAQGMPDTVIWNPGPERCAAIADLPDDAWRNFVCIEAAAVERPVSLAAGATWRGAQRMTDM